MRLSPQLNFNGQCAEAVRFYQHCLGAKVQMMMSYGESPMADHVSPEWRDKIMHATLVVGDTELGAADSPPGYYEKPGGLAVAIQIDDPAEADRIFQALGENGTVTMPIQETFWAARFGMLTDRFGIPWMINCGKAE